MDGNNLDWRKRVSYLVLAFFIAIGFLVVATAKVRQIWYLLAIASLIVSFEITGIVHELGHFISAKKNGFEVVYCAFPNFVYDKTSKIKFKFILKGDYLGETRFYPKTAFNYAEGFQKTLKSGIYAHIVVAAVLNAMLILSLVGAFGAVSPIFAVAFAFAPYSVYALIVNVVPWFHPENDGATIKRLNENREEYDAIFNFYSIQKDLFEGKSYAEIPSSYFSVSERVSEGVRIPILVFAFRRALEVSDGATADAIAEILMKENFSDVATDLELLYKYALDGNAEKVKRLEGALTFIEGEDYPVALKALLAHAKFRGDGEYLRVAKPSAIKVCENTEFCKGDVIYNKRLIERL